MKPATLVFALMLLSGLALAGCSNTMNGVGKDVEHAGQSIQRTF